jgi:3-methyladenine DNA glycosylase AlkC
MITWADHPHPFVRRLASEGFRPRLPWGMGIPSLKKDPTPVLLVLEKLKSDPSETVRRSVANNLNDISKDHPELALMVLKKWKGLSPETDLLIKHAGRGLLKKGNENVMALFGFNPGITAIEISNVKHDKQVVIGEKFSFSFTITNLGRKGTDTRVEYMIEYLTSSGKISKKVFQVRERNMSPGMSEFISKRQSFANLTTRKHYPGRHKLSIVLNGKAITSFTFLVKA